MKMPFVVKLLYDMKAGIYIRSRPIWLSNVTLFVMLAAGKGKFRAPIGWRKKVAAEKAWPPISHRPQRENEACGEGLGRVSKMSATCDVCAAARGPGP